MTWLGLSSTYSLAAFGMSFLAVSAIFTLAAFSKLSGRFEFWPPPGTEELATSHVLGALPVVSLPPRCPIVSGIPDSQQCHRIVATSHRRLASFVGFWASSSHHSPNGLAQRIR